jgi:hypothetical protein
MLHPLRRQTLVMSILMDFDPDDKDNDHFQAAIDQWQAVFDVTASSCDENSYEDDPFIRRHTQEFSSSSEKTRDTRDQDEFYRGKKMLTEDTKKSPRSLADTSPFGTGGWDPFHPSLRTVSFMNLYFLFIINEYVFSPDYFDFYSFSLFIIGATGAVSPSLHAALSSPIAW